MYNKVTELCNMITSKKGTPLATIAIKGMTKAEQVKTFGVYIGKGTIWVDGEQEVIEHHVKVCFGTDTEVTKTIRFKDMKD